MRRLKCICGGVLEPKNRYIDNGREIEIWHLCPFCGSQCREIDEISEKQEDRDNMSRLLTQA